MKNQNELTNDTRMLSTTYIDNIVDQINSVLTNHCEVVTSEGKDLNIDWEDCMFKSYETDTYKVSIYKKSQNSKTVIVKLSPI